MSITAEGTFPCRVVSPALVGASDDRDAEGRAIMFARVNVELIAGPDKGKRMTWENEITTKTMPFVRRSLLAVGWKGKSMGTVSDDVKVGAETVAEIVHYQIRKGPRTGEFFAKIRNLGDGTRKLDTASKNQVAELDALMRGDFGGGGDGASQSADDDIPLATCSIDAEPSAIARILRGGV